MADPSERNDLYATAGHESIITELKAMYEAERKVAVYPCLRGPAGHANKDGVLQHSEQTQTHKDLPNLDAIKETLGKLQ